MSSNKDLQIHPTTDQITKLTSSLNSTLIPETASGNHDSGINGSEAWQESNNIQRTKSLGHDVRMQVSHFTNQLSSEEESDDQKDTSATPKHMTRSLGRSEVHSLLSGSCKTSSVLPVSERSAAYEELISSRNHWRSSSASPKHSTTERKNSGDNSPSHSRIESNPFFQLDKRAKMHASNASQSTSSLLDVDKKVQKEPPSPLRTHNSVAGMSVQMRIQIWREKEKEAEKTAKKEAFRKSSDPILESKSEDESVEVAKKEEEKEAGEEVEELTVQSDDELTKGNSNYVRPIRENFYEEIKDAAGRIEMSDSSSEDSFVCSPARTTNTDDGSVKEKLSEKGSPKTTKKKKRSKWKLRSPLVKRKSKSKESNSVYEDEKIIEITEEAEKEAEKVSKKSSGKAAVKEMRSKSVGGRSKDLDSFLSRHKIPEETATEINTETPVNQHLFSDTEALPSVFDKVDSRKTLRENRSISRDIIHIIDSLGTIEESNPLKSDTLTPAVKTEMEESTDDESDTESDDDDAQTSLDVKYSTDRQSLKRRASDGHNTHLSVGVIQRKGSLSPCQNADGVIATSLMCADAVWDRVALDADELSFRVGDVVEILDMTDEVWWYGSAKESTGWFPASFVRLRVGQEIEGDESSNSLNISSSASSTASSSCVSPDQFQRHPDPIPDSVKKEIPPITKQGNSTRRRMTIRRKDPSESSLSVKLSPEQVRAKIVEEIVNTERDYVRHLEDIIEGYLKRCREYNKLFDADQIEVIFSNVEEVYKFQKDFLKELKSRIKPEHIEQSEIGEVFVVNQHEFKVYSHYCNNHPHAVSEMNLLNGNEQYTFFFESCRLLRNLQDISLEGFLLTPVQRICKYPLQLSELLKYTNETHPDYPHVVAAQKAMKDVAMLINEQKRRIENIGKIGSWQRSIDGWKGADILETSTELIHSGELHKISKGHSQERHFFLFDHQLIYCKKDTIGGKLCYKGRVDLGDCQITDIPDGSVLHGSTPVKNGWRMNNKAKHNKWYVIYAKYPQVKEEWMKAFQRERERVKEDEDKGFHVSMKMKKAAVALCANNAEIGRGRKNINRKHVGFSESVTTDSLGKQRSDSLPNSKRLAATVSGTATSPQPSKKNKANKKRLNSVSAPITNSATIY